MEIWHLLHFPAKLHIHYQGRVKALNVLVEVKSSVNQKLWKFSFPNTTEESKRVLRRLLSLRFSYSVFILWVVVAMCWWGALNWRFFLTYFRCGAAKSKENHLWLQLGSSELLFSDSAQATKLIQQKRNCEKLLESIKSDHSGLLGSHCLHAGIHMPKSFFFACTWLDGVYVVQRVLELFSDLYIKSHFGSFAQLSTRFNPPKSDFF